MATGDNIHADEFNLTPDFGLTTTERAIADLFRGGGGSNSEFTGNKKRSYMALHPRASERTAEKRASELFKKPEMEAYLERMAQDVTAEASMTAVDILRESMEFLQTMKGLRTRVKTVIVEGTAEEIQISEYDPTGVKNAIELCGRNVNVNAFKDVVGVQAEGYEDFVKRALLQTSD